MRIFIAVIIFAISVEPARAASARGFRHDPQTKISFRAQADKEELRDMPEITFLTLAAQVAEAHPHIEKVEITSIKRSIIGEADSYSVTLNLPQGKTVFTALAPPESLCGWNNFEILRTRDEIVVVRNHKRVSEIDLPVSHIDALEFTCTPVGNQLVVTIHYRADRGKSLWRDLCRGLLGKLSPSVGEAIYIVNKKGKIKAEGEAK